MVREVREVKVMEVSQIVIVVMLVVLIIMLTVEIWMIWMMIIFMKLIQYNCLCSNYVSFDDDVVDGDLDDDYGHAITADDHDGVGASFGAADDDIHLHCEGVYEVASLAEVQAVQPDEPVGGWDQFCQQRDLVMMIILV